MEEKNFDILEKKYIKSKKRIRILIILTICLASTNLIFYYSLGVFSGFDHRSKDYYTTKTTRGNEFNEIDVYNLKINSYVGYAKPGIDARSLIDAIISLNNRNMDNSSIFIAIEYSNFENTKTTGSSAGIIGNPGEPNNDGEYVIEQSKKMLSLKGTVNTGKRYDINSVKSDENRVIKVIIKEHNK